MGLSLYPAFLEVRKMRNREKCNLLVRGTTWRLLGRSLKKMVLYGEIQAGGVPFPREWEGLSYAWPDPGLSGGRLMVLCQA